MWTKWSRPNQTHRYPWSPTSKLAQGANMRDLRTKHWATHRLGQPPIPSHRSGRIGTIFGLGNTRWSSYQHQYDATCRSKQCGSANFDWFRRFRCGSAFGHCSGQWHRSEMEQHVLLGFRDGRCLDHFVHSIFGVYLSTSYVQIRSEKCKGGKRKSGLLR